MYGLFADIYIYIRAMHVQGDCLLHCIKYKIITSETKYVLIYQNEWWGLQKSRNGRNSYIYVFNDRLMLITTQLFVDQYGTCIFLCLLKNNLHFETNNESWCFSWSNTHFLWFLAIKYNRKSDLNSVVAKVGLPMVPFRRCLGYRKYASNVKLNDTNDVCG